MSPETLTIAMVLMNLLTFFFGYLCGGGIPMKLAERIINWRKSEE